MTTWTDGTGGTRTHNPLLARQVPSQFGHGPRRAEERLGPTALWRGWRRPPSERPDSNRRFRGPKPRVMGQTSLRSAIGQAGFEPAIFASRRRRDWPDFTTARVSGWRDSNTRSSGPQPDALSHTRPHPGLRRKGSNLQPSGSEPDAPPIELLRIASVGLEPTTPCLRGRCCCQLSYDALADSLGFEPRTNGLTVRYASNCARNPR